MASPATPLLDKPTTQEAFALMLHDRVVEAERLAADLQRKLDERVPPALTTTMSLDRPKKGFFFSFKAYRDLWPAVEDKNWEAQAASLINEFLAFGVDPVLTLSVETMGKSVDGRNLMRSLDLARLEQMPDVMPAMPEVMPDEMLDILFARQYVVVEGVITSSDPRCTLENVGACIEKAWSKTWIPRDGIEEMIKPPARESRWHTLALFSMRINTQRVTELRYPDEWERLMSADGMVYYDCFGELASEVPHVFRSSVSDQLYRFAIEANDIRPDTRAVTKLIEELR